MTTTQPNPSKIFRDSQTVAAANKPSIPLPKLGPKRAVKKPVIEDPELPPTDGTEVGTPAPPPTSLKAQRGPPPKEWSAIVNHYFPQGGTGYKAGGLVRGGGAAAKGRGRGKIV